MSETSLSNHTSPNDTADAMTSKKITRKWETFAGRNKFYMDGRLMTAPNGGVFYLTVALIAVTNSLFFAFDCPYLAERVSVSIPCIGAALFLFSMGCLLRTALSDPGIIPRASNDEANHIEQAIEVPNSSNSPTLRPPPRTKEVLVREQTVKLKYCYTCKIFRPPRASHCSLCDNCVDRFDHHCPWVGNCVGNRNYRFFFLFVISLAFLVVYLFSCAITHIVLLIRDQPGYDAWDALRETPASAIVACICFLSVWSILGMAGFHTYLVSTNQTTNEDIKGSFSSKRGQETSNPYSSGSVCGNCFHILCGPMTPSMIDRRGVVTGETRMESISQRITPSTTINIEPHSMGGTFMNNSMHYAGLMDMHSKPKTASYTNLFKIDERDGEVDTNIEIATHEIDPNSVLENENHLYSNIGNSTYMNHNLDLDPVIMSEVRDSIGNYPTNGATSFSMPFVKSNLYILDETTGIEKLVDLNMYSNVTYMNHNLDLDPVVLTGSKENLVSDKKLPRHNKVEVKQVSTPDNSEMSVCVSVIKDELIDKSMKPINNESKDFNMNSHNQTCEFILTSAESTWADKLPQNENGNITHETTMINTDLDLDSIDGSTVSLWPTA